MTNRFNASGHHHELTSSNIIISKVVPICRFIFYFFIFLLVIILRSETQHPVKLTIHLVLWRSFECFFCFVLFFLSYSGDNPLFIISR